MKILTRLNLAAKRAVFVIAAIVTWTWDDAAELGWEALLALVEMVGNVLHLAFAITVGPFLKIGEALRLRKRITKDTTWKKQRKSPTE